MKKRVFIILISLIVVLPVSIQGMDFHNMQLQGSGTVHYMGFIKVYDAYLYTDPTTFPGEVLSATSSRCLKLTYSVNLSKENFIEAAEKILSRQHDSQTLKKVKPHLDLLHSAYEEVRDGDSYVLCYDGNARTTRLFLNGLEQVQIESANFATVYFGIWLGKNNPLSDELRRKLMFGVSGKKS